MTVFRGGALEFRTPYPEGTDKTADVHIQGSEIGGTNEITGFLSDQTFAPAQQHGITLEDDAIVFTATNQDTGGPGGVPGGGWEPGDYILQLWVRPPAAVNPIGTAYISTIGTLRVKRSVFVDAADASPKSWREQVLEEAQKTLLTAASSAELNVGVGDFSTSFESRRDLIAFIRGLEREIHAEKYGLERNAIEMEL